MGKNSSRNEKGKLVHANGATSDWLLYMIYGDAAKETNGRSFYYPDVDVQENIESPIRVEM